MFLIVKYSKKFGIPCLCYCGRQYAISNSFLFLLQMRMAPLGLDNLVVVSDEARQAAYDVARRGGGGVDSKQVCNCLLTNSVWNIPPNKE